MATIAKTVYPYTSTTDYRPGDKTASIMISSYPVYEKEYDDPTAASQYEQIIAAVKVSRSLLDAYGIKQDAKSIILESLI